MKILQIIQRKQLRGAEIFCCQLSNHLRASGHDVMIVALQQGNAEMPFNGVIQTLGRPAWLRFLDPLGYFQLYRIVMSWRPDVVQANAGDTLKFVMSSKILFRWRTPVVFRNANKVSDFLPVKNWKYRYNRFFVKRLDLTISVSQICRLDFIDTYQMDATKVVTVPIGIETTNYRGQTPADMEQYRDRKLLINVGSLVPEKNHAGLLRITRALVDQETDIMVAVVGDGRLRGALEAECARQNLKDHVCFLGYRNDVHDLMCMARVLLMPSLIEGLPGVVLEAFHHRLPVVANDVGGISEVVIQGHTGELVPKGDELAFVEATLRLLRNDELAGRYKSNAYELVQTNYSNETVARRFLECYQQIAKMQHVS